jgi:AP2 domain
LQRLQEQGYVKRIDIDQSPAATHGPGDVPAPGSTPQQFGSTSQRDTEPQSLQQAHSPSSGPETSGSQGVPARQGTKGVVYHRSNNKWEARVYTNGRQQFLGYFDTREEAAQEYAPCLRCPSVIAYVAPLLLLMLPLSYCLFRASVTAYVAPL